VGVSQNVFAYGSNMCSGRLRDYGVSPQGNGVSARLAGFRLVFDKSSSDGSGKANVRPMQGNDVWGVVYVLSDADFGLLERKEIGYVRRNERVETGTMERDAWVLVALKTAPGPLLPYAWYKRFLIEGAREHGLPEEYITTLEAIEDQEDPNRKRSAKKESLKCEGPRA
jgi:gamma-glutamylcyclotransferase